MLNLPQVPFVTSSRFMKRKLSHGGSTGWSGRFIRSKRSLPHLLYGKKPHIDRIIIELDQRNSCLLVLTIRDGARNEVSVNMT